MGVYIYSCKACNNMPRISMRTGSVEEERLWENRVCSKECLLKLKETRDESGETEVTQC